MKKHLAFIVSMGLLVSTGLSAMTGQSGNKRNGGNGQQQHNRKPGTSTGASSSSSSAAPRASAPVVPAVAKRVRTGNIETIMFADNSRITYDHVSGKIQFFKPDGIEVQSVPGDIVNFTLNLIGNRRFVGSVVDAAVPVATVVCPLILATVLYKLMNALCVNRLISRVNIINHDYWAHNCLAAWERGGADYLRAAMTCSVAGASYFSTEIGVPICVFIIIFLFMYKYLNDRVAKPAH